MISGEECECLLCRGNAERAPFKDPRGWKYECPNCGLYALAGSVHSYIEVFVKDPNNRMKLSDYLKKYPPKGDEFRELTKDEIKGVIEGHLDC